ncbi:DUF4148 domain-containing protein [Burkholderia ubonensis]|uniref:DUF4148 domain-containing protein n=1 Tax=Burkholderia ubonensis TaxID=101571 RepID=UPI0008FE15CD|nr:DUF4148 domain-containing protein [Burkholderia ubonensis]
MTSKLLTAVTLISSLSYALIPSVNAKGVTRDEVMAELAELRALGYRSTAEDPHYPRHVQEMMAKLHEKRMKERFHGAEQVTPRGKSTNERTRAAQSADSTMDQNKCVGPASFCDPYFGS